MKYLDWRFVRKLNWARLEAGIVYDADGNFTNSYNYH